MRLLNFKITIVFIFCLSSTFSQNITENNRYSYNTPYKFDEFSSGYVIFNDSTFLEASLNYNVVRGEMQFIDNDTIKTIVNNDINYIIIDNYKFISLNNKYYIELYDKSNIKLLCYLKPNFSEVNNIGDAYNITTETSTSKSFSAVELKQGTGAQHYNLEGNIKEIKVFKQYYILDVNEKDILYPSLKNIMKFTNKNKKEVKKYIRDNKLKIKVKNDLLKLLKFI